MSDESELKVERRISSHELQCEQRYGEIKVEMAAMRTELQRNTRLLYVLIAGMLAVAGKTLWGDLF